MDPAESLFRLPAREVEAIFAELASLMSRQVAEAERQPVPMLTLLLESGHSLSGQLIDYLPPGRGRSGTVLIHSGDSWTSLDATYVPIGAVRGLTIHYTPATLPLLSFGRLRPLPTAPPPGRLELDRMLGQGCEDVSSLLGLPLKGSIDWSDLPVSDEARQGLGLQISDLVAVLRDIVQDALGHQSFAEKVSAVVVRRGDAPGVEIEQGTLVVRCGVDESDVRILDRVDLRREVEGRL